MLCVQYSFTYAVALWIVACFLLGTIPTCLWKSMLGDLATCRQGREDTC